VLAQKVVASPPAVGDGQRPAACGHNSIGPAEPGLPATPPNSGQPAARLLDRAGRGRG